MESADFLERIVKATLRKTHTWEQVNRFWNLANRGFEPTFILASISLIVSVGQPGFDAMIDRLEKCWEEEWQFQENEMRASVSYPDPVVAKRNVALWASLVESVSLDVARSMNCK